MIKAKAASRIQRKINRAYFDGLSQGHRESLATAASMLRAKGIYVVTGENGKVWLNIRGGMHPMFAPQK